jgi:hypothetical protein
VNDPPAVVEHALFDHRPGPSEGPQLPPRNQVTLPLGQLNKSNVHSACH